MDINYDQIYARARSMRRSLTQEERVIWELVRNRRFRGHKFLRQHPLIFRNPAGDDYRYYILDFYCAEKRLCLEIDGKHHQTQLVYDAIRDQTLQERGIFTLRIPNEEVIDLRLVMRKIEAALNREV
ncbi:MAG: DUF559 domain-containing protein [Bacteroidia bacterium]|nr:DUF559 domain-containing protein [Bacteroidia bacterium]